MRKLLLAIAFVIFLLFFFPQVYAQSNQTVVNGSSTTPINFPKSGCVYTWVNSEPSIGLVASGTGDIPLFTAINTGSSPVTAIITGTPVNLGVAYIANGGFGVNSVSVIDIAAQKVTATIPVGANPWGVAVNHAGTFAYIGNPSGNKSISVINTATNMVSATIPINGEAGDMLISSDDSKLYVNDYPYITVINTSTNTIISDFTLGNYVTPTGIALSPDGNKLYVANGTNNDILVVNTTTHAIIADILIGYNPFGIALSPDGSRLYVPYGVRTVYPDINKNDTLKIVNTANNTISAAIPVGQGADMVALNNDGSRAYVINGFANSVSVVNTTSYQVVANIPVGNGPSGLSVTADGSELLVENERDNNVSVISTATNAVTATIATGADPDSYGNFITQGAACSGGTISFKITVNPSPIITTSPISGTISACQGTASASPNIQQFTVSGSNLTATVTATAPLGFEVSLATASGYSGSVMLSPINGTLSSTTVYVRSAAGDGASNISGNVVLSSTGIANQNVAVSGVVNALPTVNQVPDQTLTSGSTTTAINFSGTGNIFTWINDTPGIGLPASGTGNIPAFTAVNNGNTPVTANITVTSVTKQAGFEYMTNETSSQVSVISNATNSIVSTIPVGAGPYGIALSPDGSMAYVANYVGSSVSVINTSENKVVATVTVNENPIGIAVSPDGSKVYVCGNGGISVIDALSNKYITGILLSNYEPMGLTVSPDGKWLYVADPNNDGIVIINTSTYQKTNINFPTNEEDSAFNVATSPDGSLIYVTGVNSKKIFVINATTQTLINPINLTTAPMGIAVSPDGSRIYVTNEYSNTVSIVNAANGALISTVPVGSSPEGISVSPDGSTVYVANIGSNTMSVINASTNKVTATIGAGPTPHSLGNFVMSSISCSGPPTTFSITVNPPPAAIIASPATGNISACLGTASASPNIQQFTVSGSNLTADVLATAPTGFEVSLTAASSYSNNITLPQSNGSLSSTIVYVRSASGDAAGNISGNVVLSSTGTINQQVTVSGLVNALPIVNPVASQTVENGATTTAINFTGTGSTYNWTNDAPGIGLAASGSGNIPSFTAVNNSNQPIVANITVIPQNAGPGCDGAPIIFTVTIDPTLPPAITTAGSLSPLTTVYGTPSESDSFTVSGTNLVSAILVNPPKGFEVSTDGVNFSSTITVGSTGTLTATSIYIRLAETTYVGNYNGNIMLTQGTTSVNVTMPTSTVTPAPLTITADNKTKPYGADNPPLTVTYNGFVNKDGSAQLTTPPDVTTTALTSSAVGQYPVTASGAVSANYSFNYIPGLLTIEPSLSLLYIPNTFTPNGDGINDTWDIKYMEYYPKSIISVFNRWGQKLYSSVGYSVPWDGTYKGQILPSGTYYYMIDPKNGQPVISGWVAIIK